MKLLSALCLLSLAVSASAVSVVPVDVQIVRTPGLDSRVYAFSVWAWFMQANAVFNGTIVFVPFMRETHPRNPSDVLDWPSTSRYLTVSVASVSGGNSVGMNWRRKRYIIVTAWHNGDLLAHELAHQCGLKHATDRGNLMTPTMTGHKLTALQLDALQKCRL